MSPSFSGALRSLLSKVSPSTRSFVSWNDRAPAGTCENEIKGKQKKEAWRHNVVMLRAYGYGTTIGVSIIHKYLVVLTTAVDHKMMASVSHQKKNDFEKH